MTTTTSESPWTDEQLEVIDAFEAAEEAYRMAIASPGTAAIAELAATHIDDVVIDVRESIEGNRERGHRTRWPNGVAVVATYLTVEIDGTSAFVAGCLVDDAVVVDDATGAVVDNSIVERSFMAEFRTDFGMWLLVGIDFDGEGRSTC